MNQAYLLIGGNIGNRLKNLARAKQLIGENCGPVNTVSAIYETAAWGKEDQPGFLNQALSIRTTLNAEELMTEILGIEKKMGRIRAQKWTARIIDIDILFFNNEVYNSEFIHIPHPQLPNRKFALIPLAEIAGKYVHPVLKKTILRLLKDCADTLEVKKYEDVKI
jgi:2-amino-4-hydroxy-6-hydroxymethyldihydropteridine diphosphokinase